MNHAEIFESHMERSSTRCMGTRGIEIFQAERVKKKTRSEDRTANMLSISKMGGGSYNYKR
jgi:hypothetical protein